MSDDLIERLRKQDMRQRSGGYFVFNGIMAEAATALTEARASADHWRRAIEIIATIIGLPEPEANFASKVRAAFDDLRSQLHDANGVADLAIKHRDAAESELSTLRARVREVVGPFAKAGELFGPRLSDEYDQCIYSPAAGDEYSLCGDHLRAARQLNEDLK